MILNVLSTCFRVPVPEVGKSFRKPSEFCRGRMRRGSWGRMRRGSMRR